MKKMLLAVLVLAAMLSAAIVPVDKAQKVAENYYQNYAPTMSKDNVVVKTLTKEYMGQPTWYVFKFTKGFVIVSADDNVDPILGHSFDGIIDEDIYNMQNPFVARFSGYDKQIVHSIREKNLDRPAKQKEWKDIENNVFPNVSSKVQVGPLLQTKWGQGYPWNLQTPQQTYVGCVATAMHQIMRFHQGPTAGNGTHTDVDLSGDIQGSWTVNFGAATYDWSLMQGIYASDFDTEEKRNEVAELSYHCGIAVDMDYDSDGSGTQTSYVPAALENYFSFSTDAVYQTLGTVTDSSYFATTIQINLNQNRPIEWCGYPSTGAGHAFVLDGYKDGYWYSFNWGWSGSYDGWFKINDLTPGVSDFTFSQGCAHTLYVNGLLAQMPPPQNLAQSVSTDGDVTLTWNAPTTVDPMGTLIDYAIYRDRELIAYKGDLVRSYVDPAMPEGDYLYTVRAVYENPDGESLISNEVTAVVSPDPGFPVPIAFSATSYQFVRSKIDLAWTKPFVGTALFQDGFETGNTAGQPPVGWTQRRSDGLDQSGMTWGVPAGAAPDQGFVCSTTTTHLGTYSLLCNDGDTTNEYKYYYLFTPPVSLVSGQSMLKFWCHQLNNDGIHHIVLYNGNFTEPDPSVNMTVFKTGVKLPWLDGADGTWSGEYYTDLGSANGTYRVGIVKEITNAVYNRYDDFFFGVDSYPSGVQPTSYEIYRQGNASPIVVPVTGINETYEDTSFEDGWNEYYVRAVYPTGKSISGSKDIAWIDANPVPHYLEGTYDEINDNCDISWYAPGHYPAHWFAWEFENDDWFYLAYVGSDNVTLARTYFTAEAFGMNYPVYIDQISAAFYEDAGVQDWASNQFKYAIGYGRDDNATYLHTSANLTAIEDGTFIDYTLPSTLTITEPWFVEVQFVDLTSATPSPMTLVHEEGVGIEFNSVWYWSGDGTNYDPGYYAYTYVSPYGSEDFMFYCYGWNDEPTITKEGIVQPERVEFSANTLMAKHAPANDYTVAETKIIAPKNKKEVQPLYSSNKGLQTYQVWRNGSRYDTSTGTSYSDTNPLPNNVYYITALYTDPVGESEGSNEITLGPPAYAQMPVSIIKNVSSGTSDTGTFDLGNTGGGYLNYTLSYEYTDVMSQMLTPVDEHFASSLGTFTSSANWAYSTTVPTYETGYARIASVNNATRSGYLTSATFDISGLNATKFDYAYLWNGNETTAAYLSVQYSTDGTNYTELIRYDVTDQLTWATASQTLPNNAVKVRFSAVFPRTSGLYAGVDVIQVTGDEYLIDPWFSFVSAVEGTVLNNSSNTITCGYDATNLPDGEYHANVIVDSNDEVNPQIITPVVFTVGGTGPVIPAVPANLVTSVVGGQVVLNWDDSADATEYYIYSSADPYGTYSQIDTVVGMTNSTYTYTGTETKMFFYVIAGNATKTAPKTIEIAKPASSR